MTAEERDQWIADIQRQLDDPIITEAEVVLLLAEVGK